MFIYNCAINDTFTCISSPCVRVKLNCMTLVNNSPEHTVKDSRFESKFDTVHEFLNP